MLVYFRKKNPGGGGDGIRLEDNRGGGLNYIMGLLIYIYEPFSQT